MIDGGWSGAEGGRAYIQVAPLGQRSWGMRSDNQVRQGEFSE